MAEAFDPIQFRHFALGNESFISILPEGFNELFQVVRFDREQSIKCGNGIQALAKAATDFLYSGPKSLENAIALDYSRAKDLLVPLKLGEISLSGEKERPKTVSEYTEQELEEWSRFLNGLDPSNDCITRDTAATGLASLTSDMNGRVGAVSKYSLSAGEDRSIFERARSVLIGTPFVIARAVLPDLNSDEASRIFYINPSQHPVLVETFVERAQGPIFEVPER